MRQTIKILLAVLLLIWVPGANAANNEAVGNELGILFATGKATSGLKYTDSHLAAIKRFYAQRNFKPIWVRDNGPKGKAKALVAEIRISAVHGLSPSFYNFDAIEKLMQEKAPEGLARLELLLTGSFVEFGRDLLNGRISAKVTGSMNAIVSHPVKPDAYIKEAESAGNLRDYMSGLLQSDKRYVRLIAKLSEFLRIDASGQWPLITSDIEPVRADHTSKPMNLFRKLLVLTGDLPFSAMAGGNTHDQISIRAVKSYQLRHGLPQTGDIDRETILAMSVPVASRIRQIRINLERRRWQVHAIGDSHVYINLADQSLRIVNAGKTVAVHKLLKNANLVNVPAFVGSIEFDKQNAAAKPLKDMAVNSDFISSFSLADKTQSISVLSYLDFVKDIDNFVKQSKNTPDQPVSLPLFVTYVTAWATKDGRMHFRKDIYNRDRNLATLLGLDN